MRVEKTQVPVGAVEARAGGAPKASVTTSTAVTSDVVALTYSLQVAGTSGMSAERAAAVDALKQAYESGAIRPDPARVANHLIRWSSQQDA